MSVAPSPPTQKPQGLARLTGRMLAGLLLAACLLTGLMLGSGSAAAQDGIDDGTEPTNEPAPELVSISLRALTEVSFDPRQPSPVEISVTSRRAVAGRLVVRDPSIGDSWEYEIDQAAGTTTVRTLWLKPGWNGLFAEATIEADGNILAEEQLRAFPTGSSQQGSIATFGIEAAPRTVTVLGASEPTPILTLGPELDPATVSGLSTLVVSVPAMSGIDATSAAATVDAWIRGGGQLIVAGPDRSLDDRYHAYPTQDPSRFLVGAGSVLYDSDWEDGVPIGGYLGSGPLRSALERQGFGIGSGGELARLAGLALPAPRLIAILLLGYAMIAGPILFLALRRIGSVRKIWLLLPAFALATAAGLLVYGLAAATGRSEAHITIVEVDTTNSTATTSLLLTSRAGGSREIAAGPGWFYLGQSETSTPRNVRVRPGAQGVQARIELPPGSAGTMRLAGPAPDFDAMLRIGNIVLTNDGVSAEFVNQSGVALQDVIAMAGNARVELGDVAAGATVEFTIDPASASGRTMQELQAWTRVRSRWTQVGQTVAPTVDPEDDDLTEAGTWSEWRMTQGVNAVPDHIIGVVGWTDALPSAVGGVDEGNTALFIRTSIPTTSQERPVVTGVHQPPVTDRPPIFGAEFDVEFPMWEAQSRFSTSPGTDLDSLSLSIDRTALAVGVWADGGWLWTTDADGPLRNEPIGLPPGVTGEIYVRLLYPLDGDPGASHHVFVAPSPTAVTRDWSEAPTFSGDGPFAGFGGVAPLPVPPPGPPMEAPQIAADGQLLVDSLELAPLEPGGTTVIEDTISADGTVVYFLPGDAGDFIEVAMIASDGPLALGLFDRNGGTASDAQMATSMTYEIGLNSTGTIIQLAGEPGFGFELIVERLR